MKRSVESRIVECRKHTDDTLLQLCRQWKPEKRENKLPELDPVSCVFRLHKRKLRVLMTALISTTVLSMLALVVVDGATFSITSIQTIGIIAIWTICPTHLVVLTNWPQSSDSWTIANAIQFIEAIRIAEESIGKEFTEWGLPKDGQPCNKITRMLIVKALKVQFCREVPWKSEEADRKFEEWKKLHELMRRLFPSLPLDYKEYFKELYKDPDEELIVKDNNF